MDPRERGVRRGAPVGREPHVAADEWLCGDPDAPASVGPHDGDRVAVRDRDASGIGEARRRGSRSRRRRRGTQRRRKCRARLRPAGRRKPCAVRVPRSGLRADGEKLDIEPLDVDVGIPRDAPAAPVVERPVDRDVEALAAEPEALAPADDVVAASESLLAERAENVPDAARRVARGRAPDPLHSLTGPAVDDDAAGCTSQSARAAIAVQSASPAAVVFIPSSSFSVSTTATP